MLPASIGWQRRRPNYNDIFEFVNVVYKKIASFCKDMVIRPMQLQSLYYHPRSERREGGMFSVVSVFVCLFVNAITLEPFEISS